jgi:hypothetical protein
MANALLETIPRSEPMVVMIWLVGLVFIAIKEVTFSSSITITWLLFTVYQRF